MVKVIYIAGSTRSGSTLLGSILGQVEGVFFAGEVYRIWHPRDRTAGLCSCGKKEEECEVWSAIFKDAFGDINKHRKSALYERSLYPYKKTSLCNHKTISRKDCKRNL